MYTSYAISEGFNVQSAIWAVAGGIYRTALVIGKAQRVAVKVAFLVYHTVMLLAVLAWKGKPSLSTMLLVGKALGLTSFCAAGMALVFLAPQVVAAVGIIVVFAFVTKPR